MMKHDIVAILKKDFEMLSQPELEECVELFSTKEEFLALKKSMSMIKSEQMKDEITPNNQLKSSLMNQFNQKWKEGSTSWHERLIAFILGPSKPLIARPWFVATGIAAVALLVFVTLPFSNDPSQMAEVYELSQDENETLTKREEALANEEVEAGARTFSEKVGDNTMVNNEGIRSGEREFVDEDQVKDATADAEVGYFSLSERMEVQEVVTEEKTTRAPSVSQNKKGDYQNDQLKPKTLSETETAPRSDLVVTGSADKKVKVEFKHSDWLDGDAERENNRVLSKAKTDLLFDLLEPAF